MRLTWVLFWLLAFTAQPAAAQGSLASQVQNQLAMLVTSKSADVGIAAIDLATGETVSVRLRRQPGGPMEERFVDFIYYPIMDPDGTGSGVVRETSDRG